MVVILRHEESIVPRLKNSIFMQKKKDLDEHPSVIFKNLSAIMQAADAGSVIAKDHAAKILTTLSKHKKYRNVTLPVLIDFINSAPENQFPTYAENAMSAIDGDYKMVLLQVLESRINKMKTPTKIVRVEKLIKKLSTGK